MGTLVRTALSVVRTVGKKVIKAPKIAIYKGKKGLQNTIKGNGMKFIPHFFIYAESVRTPGTGDRYDIGAGGAAEFFSDIRDQKDLSLTTSGQLLKTRTSRAAISKRGDKLNRIPVAYLTFMQFVAWENTAYKPFVGGLDYCLIGTNCASWTIMATKEAKIASKLPLYP